MALCLYGKLEMDSGGTMAMAKAMDMVMVLWLERGEIVMVGYG
jgi:hypothetical protein